MFVGRIALLALGLTGCSSDEVAMPCEVDATTPIEIVVAGATGDVQVLADGGELALQFAPQGGFITLIAPRIQLPASVDRCQLQIGAAVRNPTTSYVLGLEQRPIMLEREGAWLQPPSPAQLSDLANVAMCPIGEAVAGLLLRVEVDVLAPNGQPIASTQATAVPRCAAGDGDCRASCAAPF